MEYLKSELNDSDQSELNIFDLPEGCSNEIEQCTFYKVVTYIFGTIIVFSNLIVVVSSGLILRNGEFFLLENFNRSDVPTTMYVLCAFGQKLKSTYLLLGNVSLADTIIGISIIVFRAAIEGIMSSETLCLFHTGTLVCPALVSIFTVGLIAVDRYIYIVHGLYYQRWVNTTRVRMGIVCVWLAGIGIGFLPAIGWVNTELQNDRCHYVSLFPGELILFNSTVSILPIILVAILYSCILVKALQNVRKIRASLNIVCKSSKNLELRICRSTGICKSNLKEIAKSVKPCKEKPKIKKIQKSASFNGISENDNKNLGFNIFNQKSKSNSHLDYNKASSDKNCITLTDNASKNFKDSNTRLCSKLGNNGGKIDNDMKKNSRKIKFSFGERKSMEVRQPNKWRAIIMVMLTTGGIVVTWMPFFVTVLFYVTCQEKLTNLQCLNLRLMLDGPIATLALINSFLNPLIYVWWNKGFRKSLKMCFRKCFTRNF